MQVIERVRVSSKPRGWYRDFNGKRRYSGATRWYVYWRVVVDGKLVNTFLTKKAALKWARTKKGTVPCLQQNSATP